MPHPHHPSPLPALLTMAVSPGTVLQWDIFNEGDCVQIFPDVPSIVGWLAEYDSSRLVDTNSGGGANDLAIGDVNDHHT